MSTNVKNYETWVSKKTKAHFAVCLEFEMCGMPSNSMIICQKQRIPESGKIMIIKKKNSTLFEMAKFYFYPESNTVVFQKQKETITFNQQEYENLIDKEIDIIGKAIQYSVNL